MRISAVVFDVFAGHLRRTVLACGLTCFALAGCSEPNASVSASLVESDPESSYDREEFADSAGSEPDPPGHERHVGFVASYCQGRAVDVSGLGRHMGRAPVRVGWLTDLRDADGFYRHSAVPEAGGTDHVRYVPATAEPVTTLAGEAAPSMAVLVRDQNQSYYEDTEGRPHYYRTHERQSPFFYVSTDTRLLMILDLTGEVVQEVYPVDADGRVHLAHEMAELSVISRMAGGE